MRGQHFETREHARVAVEPAAGRLVVDGAADHHRRRVVAQASAALEHIADRADRQAAAYFFHPRDEKLAPLAVQLSQCEPAYAAFVGNADPRKLHETAPKSHATGYLDEKQLARWLPESRDVDVYFLGPVAFMMAVKKHVKAIGVPESQSRYEFFGPACALE